MHSKLLITKISITSLKNKNITSQIFGSTSHAKHLESDLIHLNVTTPL